MLPSSTARPRAVSAAIPTDSIRPNDIYPAHCATLFPPGQCACSRPHDALEDVLHPDASPVVNAIGHHSGLDSADPLRETRRLGPQRRSAHERHGRLSGGGVQPDSGGTAGGGEGRLTEEHAGVNGLGVAAARVSEAWRPAYSTPMVRASD